MTEESSRLAVGDPEMEPSLVEFDLRELGPASVGLGGVGVLGPGAVEVGAANRAQTGAVLAAEDRAWEIERQRVARPAGKVEQARLDIGRVELLAGVRLRYLARIDLVAGVGGLEAAHARPVQAGREAQAQRVPLSGRARDVQVHRNDLWLDGIDLGPERERLDADGQLEPAALTGGEPQGAEVEGVDRSAHTSQLRVAERCHDWRVSSWFRTYGYASVYERLIIGAMPLDQADVRMLAALGVSRVLNLVEDGEYTRGARRKVEKALLTAEIQEVRLSTEDYGALSTELLEQGTAQVNSWLDEGEVVYLHCRAGWQRSAAVAAGAIALRDGIELEPALAQVQRLKPNADPLPHQREDLQRWFDTRVRS